MNVSRSLVMAAALALGACATLMGGPQDVDRARALIEELRTDADLMYVSASVRGDNVYLIRFHYLPPGGWDTPTR